MAMLVNPPFSNGYAAGDLGIGVLPYYSRFDYANMASKYYLGGRSDEHTDMVRFASLEEGKKVLDLGCGPGNEGYFAAKLVGTENVYFVDREPSMIELALENFSEGYGLPKDEIRSQFHIGNAFEEDLWANLHMRFDVIIARRFVNQFDSPEKVLQLLLDHTTPTGSVIFDFLAASPAYDLVRGAKTKAFALRWLHSFPTTLKDAGLGVKVEVSDMHILMADFEMEEIDREVRELAENAGAEVLATRSPRHELPPPEKIVDRSQEFWRWAEEEREAGSSETQSVLADFARREYMDRMIYDFDCGIEKRRPYPLMYSVFVSVQKKARGKGNVTPPTHNQS